MQVLYPDGSSLVTSAALSRPPSVAQRHQFDYAFDCLELRSVDFTAALDDNSLPQAVDATSASLSDDEMRSVCHTAGTWRTAVSCFGVSHRRSLADYGCAGRKCVSRFQGNRPKSSCHETASRIYSRYRSIMNIVVSADPHHNTGDDRDG
jgi:hypothetical protein